MFLQDIQAKSGMVGNYAISELQHFVTQPLIINIIASIEGGKISRVVFS